MNYLKKWMDAGIQMPSLGGASRSISRSPFVSSSAMDDIGYQNAQTQNYANFNLAREEADKERDYDMNMAAIRAFSNFGGDAPMPQVRRRQPLETSRPLFSLAQPAQMNADPMSELTRNHLAQYLGGFQRPNSFGGRAM